MQDSDRDRDHSPPLRLRTKFIIAALAVAAGDVLWLLLLYPLLPVTSTGWIAALLSGAMVTGWVCACGFALIWLQAQQRYVLFFRAIGALVAVSLGGGVFLAVYFARDFVSTNFSYFGH